MEPRVALVTGAGSPTGIGFATARSLGRDGARLAIASTTDRIHERALELEKDGVDAAGFVADLTDAADARSLVAAILARFDRIDVLVNNAGMVQTGTDWVSTPFTELDEAEWDRSIALSLKTAFNTTRAVLPGMVQGGYGRIVNV